MEFDKKAFSNVLKILCSYCGSITKYSEKTSLNRTYISKYVNERLNYPPSPKLLRKIANNSDGLFTYLELMYLCGYLNDKEYNILKKI